MNLKIIVALGAVITVTTAITTPASADILTGYRYGGWNGAMVSHYSDMVRLEQGMASAGGGAPTTLEPYRGDFIDRLFMKHPKKGPRGTYTLDDGTVITRDQAVREGYVKK